MTRILDVTDPKLAKALSSPRGAHYLAPFFARPRSVREACDYLDEPMGRVHHWVRRWMELGALEVAHRRKRAGRPIAYYRTSADEFRVPDRLLPDTLLARQLEASNQLLLRGFEASAPTIALAGELKVYQEEGQRGVTVDRSAANDLGAARRHRSTHRSSTLLLTPDETHELLDDLIALSDKWRERSGQRMPLPGNGYIEQLLVLATTPKASD